MIGVRSPARMCGGRWLAGWVQGRRHEKCIMSACPSGRCFFFFQAEDGIRDYKVTGVQTCALPICAAVKSLDPQVLEIIGGEQTELHGSRNDETVDRFAWIYVACQRGLNCSATSRWAKDCPEDCDVSSPEGIIMAWSRDEWPAVQQRAREINAKLDAGKWDELGLSP